MSSILHEIRLSDVNMVINNSCCHNASAANSRQQRHYVFWSFLWLSVSLAFC